MSVALQSAAMSDAEWQARCDLSALYRIAEHFGWTDIINTHISARVPGEPETFLLNRYGDMFDEVTASRLIKMDMDGKVIGEQGPHNAAGFTIHSAVYKSCPEAMCVLHTHTRAGVACALVKDGLRPISQDALYVYDALAWHEFGVPATQDECEALGESCRRGSAVVLLNHGLLAWGFTIPGAFKHMYYLERASEIEVAARMQQVAPHPIDPEVVAAVGARNRRWRADPKYGVAEFEGLQRVLERKGGRWKQ
ncbi:class II aldolase/adducin family protein [Siccirubricoccus phaeus]|uniref:class II aldolase/adducin family protein n=1 Tax=Siccirubricoccus phaeus TaxID=2595053 RepID=UPI00165CA3B4|nr:class II aldolase/adducin family protein [Siccirubricoccus phaeus]